MRRRLQVRGGGRRGHCGRSWAPSPARPVWGLCLSGTVAQRRGLHGLSCRKPQTPGAVSVLCPSRCATTSTRTSQCRCRALPFPRQATSRKAAEGPVRRAVGDVRRRYAGLSDRASRAMAYVGMTRGRDENHLAIYPAASNEAHEHHDDLAGIHQGHRGSKYTAAQYFRMLVANDERARTMHTVAARTDRALLPTSVAALLDRNDRRRTDRAHAWSAHTVQNRAREAAYQRISTSQRAATRGRSRNRDQGYGLEL
jgi:hypothetical protein